MNVIALVRGTLSAKQGFAKVMSLDVSSVRDLLSLHRRASRQAARAVFAGVFRGILPWSILGEWLGLSSSALVGVRPVNVRERLLAHARAMRLHLGTAKNARAALISFCKNHRNASRIEPWLLRVLEERPSPALTESSHISLAELEEEQVLGMHALETVEGKSFRWTGWVSAMLVHPPRDFKRVVISPHPFTPELQPEKDMLVYLDGMLLGPNGREHGKFVFEASVSQIPRGGPAWLTIVCRPFNASGDPRSLGLPIGEVSFLRS
jgi:hypothetical protein